MRNSHHQTRNHYRMKSLLQKSYYHQMKIRHRKNGFRHRLHRHLRWTSRLCLFRYLNRFLR